MAEQINERLLVMLNGNPHVYEKEGVGGGYPQVWPTRIPVRCIIEVFRSTQDFDRTAAMYPQLTHEQVRGALDYYAAHRERVDEDIERNARVFQEYLARDPRSASL